jgi:hypothetical protein
MIAHFFGFPVSRLRSSVLLIALFDSSSVGEKNKRLLVFQSGGDGSRISLRIEPWVLSPLQQSFQAKCCRLSDRLDQVLFSAVHNRALRGGDSFGWIIGQVNARSWQMEHLCSHFPSRVNVVRAPWHPGQLCLVSVALG